MNLPLSAASLSVLRARGVKTPLYDRSKVSNGVLHFGPGAFHRVHQAWYFEALLHADARWGICEVALHSRGVRDALAPQDGLYTLAVLDSNISYEVIGAAREFLVAAEARERVLQRFIDPATHFVSSTVTEKGYCLTQGGLDFQHDAIRHDLSHPEMPTSFIGYLVEGLKRRRVAKLGPINIVSCDNLTNNGARLRRAVLEFASERDPQLAKWIDAEVAFPRTMVDSITPATDDALRAKVPAAIGVHDRWPVQREAFTQWIVEKAARGTWPDLSAVGVTLTDNVGAYEQAKLRLLNGTHSALAYLGLLAGKEFVSEAMTDVSIAAFVEGLMNEIKPSVVAPTGLDLEAYAFSLRSRFRNSALPHRLAQIAWDGSQKIPYRLLGTFRDNLLCGRDTRHLSAATVGWFYFVRKRASARESLIDPLAPQLNEIGLACNGDAASDVDRFLDLRQVFPAELATAPSFRDALISAYRRLDPLYTHADTGRLIFGAA